MKLENFIQRNKLNTYKYFIKGYCEKTLDNLKIILFFIEDIASNKMVLKFDIKNETIDFKTIKINKFEMPLLLYDDKKIIFENFYRPIGCLQTKFTLSFLEDNTIICKSAAFDIIESPDKSKCTLTIHEKDRYVKISEQNFFKKMSKQQWIPDKMIVHDGKMHADDIFAAALARYINPNIKIIRTREIPEGFDGLIADVGNGRYDHHQDKKYRVNTNTGENYIDDYGNIKTYAAFGLLAKDILPGLIGDKSYYTIDHQFISVMDNSDNYGTFNDVGYLFEGFNPIWNTDDNPDDKFEEAVKIATTFLKQLIEREMARTEAIPYVKNALKQMKDNILILDKRAPWQGMAKKSSALLTIYPVDNGFAIQTVQEDGADARTNTSKILLPEEWLANPPEGLTFCHTELFFAIFDTKENAILAAKSIINNF